MDYAQLRAAMVDDQLRARGIRDPAVLGAMLAIERHRFIPEDNRDLAYRDGPVGIGEGQTISQPYIVALMTAELRLTPGMQVLEIGTGSGYQAAVLAALGVQVHSIEVRPRLLERARVVLDEIGANQVQTQLSSGFQGLADHAPFDRIIVTAAPRTIPAALTDQLRIGGIMLIPVGERERQTLLKIERTPTGLTQTPLIPVLFVPMTADDS